jgi:hypothetical protein
MFRLFIDIPLSMTEKEAVKVSQKIMSLVNVQHILNECGVEQINYRLGHDEDRQKSNYLEKTESGHVTNKKSKIDLTASKSVV